MQGAIFTKTRLWGEILTEVFLCMRAKGMLIFWAFLEKDKNLHIKIVLFCPILKKLKDETIYKT